MRGIYLASNKTNFCLICHYINNSNNNNDDNNNNNNNNNNDNNLFGHLLQKKGWNVVIIQITLQTLVSFSLKCYTSPTPLQSVGGAGE